MSMTGTLPAGWTLFGASIEGPSGTLQRARGPDGRIGIVVQFRPDMAHHQYLEQHLDPALEFLQHPGMGRILPLLHRDPSCTWFLYPIDDGRLVSELIEAAVLAGNVPGERVAMELVGQTARILEVAAHQGEPHGLTSHGDVNPWRLVVKPSGEVHLLGYGLLPVETIDWLDGESDVPPGAGFRYTPPEWLVDEPEYDLDPRSDLYGLGMVAAELALGEPLLKGTPESLRSQIPSQDFWPKLGRLSKAARTVLGRMLNDTPEGRPGSLKAFANEAQMTSIAMPGTTLSELVTQPPSSAEPGLPLPPLDPPVDLEADTDPAMEVPTVLDDRPVQSDNVRAWDGEDDPFGEESELVAYEAAMSRLTAQPPPREMPLLDEAIEVPEEPAAHHLRPRPEPDAPRSAPTLLLLTAVNVDLDARQVIRHDGPVSALSDEQAAVLSYLATTGGREVTVEEIWSGALRGRIGSSASIKSMLVRLRELIEQVAKAPDHLVDGDKGGFRLLGVEESTGPAPLPEPEGELVGRDRELEELIHHFKWEEHVLATVVGPPGSGASQLALAAVRKMQSAGFTVHRAVVGGRDFGAALANGMGIRSRGRPANDVLRDIGQRLQSRSDLVILLEAPHPHARLKPTVAGWLTQSPRSVIVVVARSPLRLPGEKVVPLAPLELEQAVALLRDRVEHHRPGAEMSDDTARAIVEFLDRMPVAIDAAAQHTAYFSPESLLERLAKGLDLDFGEGGSASMDANLAEIVAQLDPLERKVLDQLSVFEGGFDIAATEAVVRLPQGKGRREVLLVIEELASRSLLREVEVPEGVAKRWALFELGRGYLRRTVSPEEQLPVAARHARYYAGMGLQQGSGPWVEQGARRTLGLERQNLQATLERGGYEAAGAAVGLTAILGAQSAGALVDDVAHLAMSLDMSRDPTEGMFWAASRIAKARSHLYEGQTQHAVSALREAASEMAALDVRLRVDLAWMYTELGSSYGAEAALYRMKTTDPWALAVIALIKGRAELGRADPKGGIDAAKGMMIRARQAFEELGARVGRAHTQRHLAEIAVLQSETDVALASLDEARQTFETVVDTASALECRVRAAELQVGRDRIYDHHQATEQLERVMADAKRASALGLAAFARGILAVVHAMDGRHESAEHHFYLALAAPSRHHLRIQALFSLYRLLMGNPETALQEARAAEPDPVARAVAAVLVRDSPPADDEAYLVYDALEAWRARAPLGRIDAQLGTRASLAVRMVLAAPPPEGAGP